MSNIIYHQREIVLVPFPYSDLSTSKKRPALIVSNSAYNQQFRDVIICVITSKRLADKFSVPLDHDNLEIGMLPEPSVVKVHKLFTLQQDRILKKFSVVTPEYFENIIATLQSLIKP